jgi:uncharacterized protein
MSGSVSAFAGFAVAFVSSLHGMYSRVRSFAFIENVVEVTEDFTGTVDPLAAARKINAQTDLVWSDGHSDYGRALTQFVDKFGNELSQRVVVLVLGDARANSRAPHPEALAQIAASSRAVYWLTPDPTHLWTTADCVIDRYRPFLTSVSECRTVRQSAEFIDAIGQ